MQIFSSMKLKTAAITIEYKRHYDLHCRFQPSGSTRDWRSLGESICPAYEIFSRLLLPASLVICC